MAEIRIYEDLCKGVDDCGICVSLCPRKLFQPGAALNRKGYRPPQVKEPEVCTQCGNCMIYCPDLAVAVEERKPPKGGRP